MSGDFWNNQPGGHQGPQEQHIERKSWAEPGLVSSPRNKQGGRERPFSWGKELGMNDPGAKDCSLIVCLVCPSPLGSAFNAPEVQILHLFNVSCGKEHCPGSAFRSFSTGHLLHACKKSLPQNRVSSKCTTVVPGHGVNPILIGGFLRLSLHLPLHQRRGTL